MKNDNCMAALFDFDGVVMDTEAQYTEFWNEVGCRYFPDIPHFGLVIKGQTLTQIFQSYFKDMPAEQLQLTSRINLLEQHMRYEYVPGVTHFMKELKEQGVRAAIVTSSNKIKMEKVYAAHPEMTTWVDAVLTAELFPRSKPAPDCFLLAAEALHVAPARCVVFEDSFHGIQAGNAANMTVVGLSTTNTAESIRSMCADVIPDFNGFTFQKMKSLLA